MWSGITGERWFQFDSSESGPWWGVVNNRTKILGALRRSLGASLPNSDVRKIVGAARERINAIEEALDWGTFDELSEGFGF